MESPSLNFTPHGLFIGGRWVSPVEDKHFPSINPSNMEKLGDIPAAGEADVDLAVKAAKAGLQGMVESFDEGTRAMPRAAGGSHRRTRR